MADILDILTHEHREIDKLLLMLAQFRDRIEKVDSPFDEPFVNAIRLTQDLVENIHHSGEEELLFPALLESPQLAQGGPHCTLFMGQLIDNDLSQELLNQIGAYDIGRPESEFARKVFSQNSPLRIPVKEHLAGGKTLSFILDYISKQDVNFKKVRYLLDTYIKLITMHIDKEDRCLFAMAQKILPCERRDDLGVKYLKVHSDYKQRMAEIHQKVETLKAYLSYSQ